MVEVNEDMPMHEAEVVQYTVIPSAPPPPNEQKKKKERKKEKRSYNLVFNIPLTAAVANAICGQGQCICL